MAPTGRHARWTAIDGNRSEPGDDYLGMSCIPFREALSARLDGEPLGVPEAALAQHLAACSRCGTWEQAAARVTRRARVAAVPTVPDLTVAVLTRLPLQLPGAAAMARARVATAGLRLALLAAGVAQIGLAWPALAHGVAAMSAPTHVAHETGAWSVAVAAAFLAVAAAPRLAAGAMPLLGTFAVLLTVITLTDLGAGQVHPEREAGHVLLLIGALLVGWVAWRGRRPRPAPATTGAGVAA